MKQLFFVITIVALFASHCSADFASDCLAAQNAYRTPLNLNSLTWSDTIAKSAQEWANYLASQGMLEHSSTNYGENLASYSGTYTGDTSSSSVDSSNSDNTASNTDNNSADNSNSNSAASNTDNNSASNSNSNTDETQNNSSAEGDNSSNTNSENNGESNYNGGYNGNSQGNGYNDNAEESIEQNNRWSMRGARNQNTNNNGRSSRGHRHGRYLVSSGTSDIEKLVGLWGAEKQYFIGGTFPDVSSTGSWSDVGHYTQMVWANTQQVGCGIANGNGNEYLVCQYYPAGNMDGEKVY